MARLTITLSDDIYRALKSMAARQDTTIGELIENSLRAYGPTSQAAVVGLVAKARRRSNVGEDEALELAVDETRKDRLSRP